MSRPIRIALATNLDRGGGAILVARISRYLDPEKVTPILYLPKKGFTSSLAKEKIECIIDPDFVVPPNQKEFGIKRIWEVIKTRGWAVSCWYQAGKRLEKTIREKNIDALFAFGVEPQLFCALVGMKTQIPVFWSAQQTYDHPLNPLPLQLAGLLPSIQSVIAVSEAAAIPYRVLQDKTKVIYNGVDPEEFHPDKVTPCLRKNFSLSSSTPLIGVLGRPSREKGFDVFLRAIPSVIAKYPEARFVMIGAGVSSAFLSNSDQYLFEKDIHRLIQELGIEKYLVFTGPVDDVKPYLLDLDILALPSRRDAAPLVAFEGMALERPVVGSAVHGIPEIIQDQSEGLLSKAEDEKALARSIRILLENPARQKRMGKAGRQRVCKHFDIRQNMKSLSEYLYRSIRKKRG